MLSKWLLIFSFCLVSFIANAQILRIQKNGTLKTVQLHLPKKISIIYMSDSGIVLCKGRAYDYDFPYLLLKRKQDTLVIDVRKINGIRYRRPNVGYYYIGSVCAFYLSANFIRSKLIGPAFVSGTIAIILLKTSHKNLDTKTEWSFY